MKIYSLKSPKYDISCELQKRKNSKNIRIRIDNHGKVKVSLPYYTPYVVAKKFINSNIDWIEKKIDLFHKQKSDYYYLGNNIRLIKKNSAYNKSFNYILNDSSLIIEHNGKFRPDHDLFIDWLRLKAKEYIPSRVAEFSQKYGFDYNSVRIKNLSSRWGSCSSKKNLSFNLKLMYFNYQVIDYVIVHELCHLKEMNHSRKFWELVEGILPNYKEHKAKLNKPIH